MKKIVVIIMIFMLAGCSAKSSEKIEVILPNGTPYIALGAVDSINVTNVNGPDLLSAAFVNTDKTYDMIVAPLNLGAKLYITGASNYELAAVITSNNNYIVSRNQMDSVSDLEGKTIMAYGENKTPGIALEKTLDDNNVNVTIDYKGSVMDIVPFFVADNASTPEYILMAEPVLSNLSLQFGLEDLHVLDLSDELDLDILQAGIFVKPNIEYDSVLKDIKDNITYLNDNVTNYANELITKDDYFVNLGVELLIESIPKCSIVYMDAKINKTAIENYFNVLNDYNTNLLNGVVPNEGFYN